MAPAVVGAVTTAETHCSTLTDSKPALPALAVWLTYITSTGIAPAVVGTVIAADAHCSTFTDKSPALPALAV